MTAILQSHVTHMLLDVGTVRCEEFENGHRLGRVLGQELEHDTLSQPHSGAIEVHLVHDLVLHRGGGGRRDGVRVVGKGIKVEWRGEGGGAGEKRRRRRRRRKRRRRRRSLELRHSHLRIQTLCKDAVSSSVATGQVFC